MKLTNYYYCLHYIFNFHLHSPAGIPPFMHVLEGVIVSSGIDQHPALTDPLGDIAILYLIRISIPLSLTAL